MEAGLKPPRLDVDIGAQDSSKTFIHWKRLMFNFAETIGDKDDKKMYMLLINYLNSDIFNLVSDTDSFATAMAILTKQFIKPINIIYQHHLLANRKQRSDENISQFVSSLHTIAKDAGYAQVTAQKNLEHSVRDALISGLKSSVIRQKILEANKEELTDIVDLALIYESAQKNAAAYVAPDNFTAAVSDSSVATAATRPTYSQPYTRQREKQNSELCTRCGFPIDHRGGRCPAVDKTCSKCSKKGHFSRCCRSSDRKVSAALYSVQGVREYSEDAGQSLDDTTEGTYPFIHSHFIASTGSSFPACFGKSIIPTKINAISFEALLDTGSPFSYVSNIAVSKANLKIIREKGEVTLASTSFSSPTPGYVLANLEVGGREYRNFKLTILPNSVSDVILGVDFQQLHSTVTFHHGGMYPPLICSLGTLKIDPPPVFSNVTPDVHPIRTKTRRFSQADNDFISKEVSRLLRDGVIEKSKSPWRAQVHIAKNLNHKKRLTVDFSQTINRFTQLDAYPVPRIDDLVNKIAQYKVFSTVDLKSAYHQVPISVEDAPYTAFEAGGGLYQFKRLPFGVTNGVAIFQRAMDTFIESNSLSSTYAYLDNIYICGKDQKEHDLNLHRFKLAAQNINLTYNTDKCEFNIRRLSILGSVIEDGEIRPDPNRLKPLLDLPPPRDMRALKRVMGFFAHYSKWIQGFSKKIKPLSQSKEFPLSMNALKAFQQLKEDVAKSVVVAIDESKTFQVETDASDTAIAATLNQDGRPVAFYNRGLKGLELTQASIEKEALAIVEAVREWRRYLTGRKFTLVTDQKSVAFMFSSSSKGKIKNDKIMRWRLELACYSFNIKYRPGTENVVPDTLSRVICSTASTNQLINIHVALCHPGVTCMCHFIKVRNLPYSVEEVRSVTRNCKICSECKPQFHKPEQSHLINATQTFQKLDLDFKGPLPSNNGNIYFLQVIDEYSKYPFVYPCSNMSAKTVIAKLCDLFAMFGMPAYVHSDRGTNFMSQELKSFLTSKGIATSRTTPYNPRGNGLVEKSNGTIWRGVTMALRSRNLPQSCWQLVLPDVLHSIRTLLCTSTNQTPHERMFLFPRRSGTGVSIPTWLATPGPVLLRRFVRNSKQEPLVDEVELIQANSNYAHIRYPGGREDTVSTRDLAPLGNDSSSKPCDPEPPLPDAISSSFSGDSSLDLTQTNVETVPNNEITVLPEIEIPKPEIPNLPKTVFHAPDRVQSPSSPVVTEATPFTPRVSARSTKGTRSQPRMNL